MKEILKITVSLTCVCISAALILGAVYTQTFEPRQRIEKKEKQEIINSLLGFGHGKERPKDFEVYPVNRYVIEDPEAGTLIGYVVPLKESQTALVRIDLAGKPAGVIPLKAKHEDLLDKLLLNSMVKTALPKNATATFAGTFYVADIQGKRYGYVLEGTTQGFKTFINMMVSLDAKLTVTGVAIVKSEEDPGLGDEIKQDFFKNQFVGKTLEMLAALKVVKDPLPSDYLDALVPARAKKAGLAPDKIEEIRKKHVKDDIYALTGATISSRAVTTGVQNTVSKFSKRFGILNSAIERKNLQIAF